MDAILAVHDISRSFGGVHAVDGVSFTVHAGEIVGALGPNGAGKTTLFNLVSGFMQPDHGDIRFAGHSLLGKRPDQVARAGVGRLFQDVRVFQRLTALENVAVALSSDDERRLFRSVFDLGRPQRMALRRRDARDRLTEVGLGEKANQSAGALSFGEQKLVALARLLATNPRLLMLDEPTAGINAGVRGILLERIRAEAGLGKAVLLIEHELDVVRAVCDRVIVLSRGRLAVSGTAEEVLDGDAIIEAYQGAAR